MDREMMEALEADGEKLRQLTDEEHGPAFVADDQRCPVCGETDPWPAWICLPRGMGAAKAGEPCQYSREGHKRMVDRLNG